MSFWQENFAFIKLSIIKLHNCTQSPPFSHVNYFKTNMNSKTKEFYIDFTAGCV